MKSFEEIFSNGNFDFIEENPWGIAGQLAAPSVRESFVWNAFGFAEEALQELAADLCPGVSFTQAKEAHRVFR